MEVVSVNPRLNMASTTTITGVKGPSFHVSAVYQHGVYIAHILDARHRYSPSIFNHVKRC